MSIVEWRRKKRSAAAVQVKAVHLKLGPLSGVVKEALLSAYELAARTLRLLGSGWWWKMFRSSSSAQLPGERTVSSMQWLCCSECDTPASEIVQGQELEVTRWRCSDESRNRDWSKSGGMF